MIPLSHDLQTPAESEAEARERRKTVELRRAMETNAQKVFRRFQEDNSVHVEDLPGCLIALGFISVHTDWIQELLAPISTYSTLPMHSYEEFLQTYTVKQNRQHRADFDSIDLDGSGTLDKQELSGILQTWGIFPMSHVLDEVIAEVDIDNNNELDFGEFEKVAEYLRLRQGFSLNEYEEINGVFSAFDRESVGLMNTEDVKIALDWLGLAVKEEQLEQIVKEVDADGSGRIDAQEWLTGMRKVRDAKVAELQQIVVDNDDNHDGITQLNELAPILCSMGYFPDDQSVAEAAAAAGWHKDTTAPTAGLDISELWRFMKIYRDHEGLTHAEVQEIQDAFQDSKVDTSVEVSAVQCCKIVRAIGYMLSFDMQQSLIAKVDIDNSGELNQREFRKMIRLILQGDLDIIRVAFFEAHELSMNYGGKNTFMDMRDMELLGLLSDDANEYRSRVRGFDEGISEQQARQALRRLGCTQVDGSPATIRVADKVGPDEVDIFGFCNAARLSRQVARSAFRMNGGFCAKEVEEMKSMFKAYDADDSGELNGREIVTVLEKHFPTLANDPVRRPLITQLLAEADEDGNGRLDFCDFLRLMRQVRDIQDQLSIGKELRAIGETMFSPTEVQEFRDLLLAVRGEATEVGFDEVRALLGAIVPMGAKNVRELHVIYDKVAARQEDSEGSNTRLDFPEFLWLMRELLDANFANISGADQIEERSDSKETPKKKIWDDSTDERKLHLMVTPHLTPSRAPSPQ